MSMHFPAETFATDEIVAPDRIGVRKSIDRSFELPTWLYGVTVGAYLAFLAVLAAAFQTRDLILPMAIFVIYIGMAFGVPAMWTRMSPENKSRALDPGRFASCGIETHTGLLSARNATIQVLILPVLILMWAVIVAIIAAIVG